MPATIPKPSLGTVDNPLPLSPLPPPGPSEDEQTRLRIQRLTERIQAMKGRGKDVPLSPALAENLGMPGKTKISEKELALTRLEQQQNNLRARGLDPSEPPSGLWGDPFDSVHPMDRADPPPADHPAIAQPGEPSNDGPRQGTFVPGRPPVRAPEFYKEKPKGLDPPDPPFAFTLDQMRESKAFRKLPTEKRVDAVDRYVNAVTEYFDLGGGSEELTPEKMNKMRLLKNKRVREVAAETLVPLLQRRAQQVTGSSDQEVIKAKAEDLLKKVYDPARGGAVDFTAPRPVEGSDKILQKRLIEDEEFRKKMTSDRGEEGDFTTRSGGRNKALMERLFFTQKEVVGDDLAREVKKIADATAPFQDVDEEVDIGDGMKVAMKSHYDPRRRDELVMSVKDPRLDAPLNFRLGIPELREKGMEKVLQERAKEIKDADEHSVFGDFQRAFRAGAVGGAGHMLQGTGDVLTSMILHVAGLQDLDVPSLGSDDAPPNVARFLLKSAEGIRSKQSLDTKVARSIEEGNLLTANRLMDIFGEGLGQITTTMASGGIGYLATGAKAGAAAGAFASNFAQITSSTTERAISLGAKPEEARLAGHVSALLGAPLETVADVSAMRLLTITGLDNLAKKNLISEVVKSASFQAMVEGGTEVSQELIANGVLKEMINKDLGITDGLMESAVAGALVGLATGGLGGAVSNYRKTAQDLDKLGKPEPLSKEASEAVDDDARAKTKEILDGVGKPQGEQSEQAVSVDDVDGNEELARAFNQELVNRGFLTAEQVNAPEADQKKLASEAQDTISRLIEIDEQIQAMELEGTPEAAEEIGILKAERDALIPPRDPEEKRKLAQQIISETKERVEQEKEALEAPETPPLVEPGAEPSPAAQEPTEAPREPGQVETPQPTQKRFESAQDIIVRMSEIDKTLAAERDIRSPETREKFEEARQKAAARTPREQEVNVQIAEQSKERRALMGRALAGEDVDAELNANQARTDALLDELIPPQEAPLPPVTEEPTPLQEAPAPEADVVPEKAIPQTIREAYDRVRSKSKFSFVPIADILDESGIPINELHDYLLQAAREGRAQLSVGDFSLASQRVRDASFEIPWRGGRAIAVKLEGSVEESVSQREPTLEAEAIPNLAPPLVEPNALREPEPERAAPTSPPPPATEPAARLRELIPTIALGDQEAFFEAAEDLVEVGDLGRLEEVVRNEASRQSIGKAEPIMQLGSFDAIEDVIAERAAGQDIVHPLTGDVTGTRDPLSKAYAKATGLLDVDDSSVPDVLAAIDRVEAVAREEGAEDVLAAIRAFREEAQPLIDQFPSEADIREAISIIRDAFGEPSATPPAKQPAAQQPLPRSLSVEEANRELADILPQRRTNNVFSEPIGPLLEFRVRDGNIEVGSEAMGFGDVNDDDLFQDLFDSEAGVQNTVSPDAIRMLEEDRYNLLIDVVPPLPREVEAKGYNAIEAWNFEQVEKIANAREAPPEIADLARRFLEDYQSRIVTDEMIDRVMDIISRVSQQPELDLGDVSQPVTTSPQLTEPADPTALREPSAVQPQPSLAPGLRKPGEGHRSFFRRLQDLGEELADEFLWLAGRMDDNFLPRLYPWTGFPSHVDWRLSIIAQDDALEVMERAEGVTKAAITLRQEDLIPLDDPSLEEEVRKSVETLEETRSDEIRKIMARAVERLPKSAVEFIESNIYRDGNLLGSVSDITPFLQRLYKGFKERAQRRRDILPPDIRDVEVVLEGIEKVGFPDESDIQKALSRIREIGGVTPSQVQPVRQGPSLTSNEPVATVPQNLVSGVPPVTDVTPPSVVLEEQPTAEEEVDPDTRAAVLEAEGLTGDLEPESVAPPVAQAPQGEQSEMETLRSAESETKERLMALSQARRELMERKNAGEDVEGLLNANKIRMDQGLDDLEAITSEMAELLEPAEADAREVASLPRTASDRRLLPEGYVEFLEKKDLKGLEAEWVRLMADEPDARGRRLSGPVKEAMLARNSRQAQEIIDRATPEAVTHPPMAGLNTSDDVQVEIAFQRRFSKLVRSALEQAKQAQKEGDQARAEGYRRKAQELRESYPSVLNSRLRKARAARAYREAKPPKPKKVKGRPLKAIGEFVEDVVAKLNSSAEELSALHPEEFVSFMRNNVLLKESDFLVTRNKDGSLRIKVGDVDFHPGVPAPASHAAKEQIKGELREEPLLSTTVSNQADLDAPFQQPLIHREQEPINAQIRLAALKWFWKQRADRSVPVPVLVRDPSVAVVVDPEQQLVHHGAHNLTRVMEFFEANTIDDVKAESRPSPERQRDFTARDLHNLRKHEAEDFESRRESPAAAMAAWQRSTQQLTKKLIAAYEVMAGAESGLVGPDVGRQMPTVSAESVEFAAYAKMTLRADGAPVKPREVDVRSALADVLALTDTWASTLYRAAYNKPDVFQEAIRTGILPEGVEVEEGQTGSVRDSEANWGRPPDMPIDIEKELDHLDTVHRGIMGDFWVATKSRRERLATDKFVANVDEEFDVGNEAPSLRQEWRNENSIRKQAFERAKHRGLRPIDVDVAEDFRDNDFEFFRRYVLEARIARESLADADRPAVGPQEVSLTPEDGDPSLENFERNAARGADPSAFGEFQALREALDNLPASPTRNEPPAESPMQRNNMNAAAVGQDYLDFLEEVRAGNVTGARLAERIIEATSNPAIKTMMQSLLDAVPQLGQIRVMTDPNLGRAGQTFRGADNVLDSRIVINEEPFTSRKHFSMMLAEELIHAASFIQEAVLSTSAAENAQALQEKALAAVDSKKPIVRRLIRQVLVSQFGENKAELSEAYNNGDINQEELLVLYSLTTPVEMLAHSAITPAVHRFLKAKGLWADAQALQAQFFGQDFADNVEAMAVNHQRGRVARQRRAEQAQAAKRVPRDPITSKAPPVDNDLFMQAWTSDDPRQFLRDNLDKISMDKRADLTPSQKKLYTDRIRNMAGVLMDAPDPSPNSKRAKRLRIAITSLFNSNLNPSLSFNMAAEAFSSVMMDEERAKIVGDPGTTVELTGDQITRSLMSTQADLAIQAKTQAGIDAANRVLDMMERGVEYKGARFGGKGREGSKSRFEAASKRIEKLAKGLSPNRIMTVIIANQLTSIHKGSPNQAQALSENWRSWRISINNKKSLAPTQGARDQALAEEESLEELSSLRGLTTFDEARKEMTRLLGGEGSKEMKLLNALLDEFGSIRDEFRFVTEIGRGLAWEPIDGYLPIVTDSAKNTIYNRKEGARVEVDDDGLISDDGNIGTMDRVGVGVQSGSLSRRGLSEDGEFWYRTPHLGNMLSALAAQIYEVETLVERKVAKHAVMHQYSPDGDKAKYFPPLVDDVRIDRDGTPRTAPNVRNARNAIEGVVEKLYIADRSGMPSGDLIRSLRTGMKLAYYNALVGFVQPFVQSIGAVAWLATSGNPITNGAQFFRALSQTAPLVGTRRHEIDQFLHLHKPSFANRVANADVEALTRQQARITPSLANKHTGQSLPKRVIMKGFFKALGGAEFLTTKVSNVTIGGSENLSLRPILITEYRRRAIENGTAKDWNDDSIFTTNIDFKALDAAGRVVDEIGASSDPANRGAAFIVQGGGAPKEWMKVALLSFAGHQMQMASNMREAYTQARFGNWGRAAQLTGNVAIQGYVYAYLTAMVFKGWQDELEDKTLALFGEYAEGERSKIEARRLKRETTPFVQRMIGASWGGIDDTIFPMLPYVGAVMSLPDVAAVGGSALDWYRNDLVDNSKLDGAWADTKITFSGRSNRLDKDLAWLGPAGGLIAEMLVDGYLSPGPKALQNLGFLIPDRALRKGFVKGLRARQRALQAEEED